MPHLVVHEGGPIVLPPSLDHGRITDQLVRQSAASPFPCFRMKKGMLHAAEAVGTVQVGSLRISILPISAEGGHSHDKAFLVRLLRAAGYLSAKPKIRVASVQTNSVDPLEILISEVASEINTSLRQGAPRRYGWVAENSQVIKGRIDFARLSRRLPGSGAAIPIIYSPLQANNVLSRIIKWVAGTLLGMSCVSTNRQSLREILVQLDAVPARRPSLTEIREVNLSKYEQHWQRTMVVAALLVEGRFIDPTYSGNTNAFGMLFPLHHLFERAMRTLLSSVAGRSGLDVGHSREAAYVLQDQNGRMQLQAKPDFLFSRDGANVMVGDAKWKRLDDKERADGIERNDVYQMNAYLTRFEISRAALFLPKIPWMSDGWFKVFRILPGNKILALVSVDIQNGLSTDPRARVNADLNLTRFRSDRRSKSDPPKVFNLALLGRAGRSPKRQSSAAPGHTADVALLAAWPALRLSFNR